MFSLSTVIGQTLRRARHPPTVSACLCVKNEARSLLEWIAYHKVWGVTEIAVYDNGGEDDSDALLVPLARSGEIILTKVPDAPGVIPQLAAYGMEFRRASKAEWTLITDVDEFLILRNHTDVSQYLAEFSDSVSQISLNWRIFGSGGAAEPTNALVIERFRRCSNRGFGPNAHTKSFVRRSRMAGPGVHLSSMRSGLSVRDDGRLTRRVGNDWTEDVSFGVAFLHHYVTKSRREFEAKIERGQSSEPPESPLKKRPNVEDFWRTHDRNEEASDLALRRLDGIKAEIERLRRIVANG